MGESKLDGWMSTAEVAELAGVTTDAVRDWVRRNAVRGREYLRRGGRYIMHPATAERYLMRNGVPAGEPEPGMVPLLQLVHELGVPYSRGWRYCHSGAVRCVRWRDRLYVNRYDMLEAERSRVPEGWVYVQDAARELGITSAALRKRLYRSGAELRHVGVRAIARREDVLNVRTIIPGDVVLAARVAAQAGVTRSAVVKWAQSRGYPVYHDGGPNGRMAYVTREAAEAYLRARAERLCARLEGAA